MWGWRVVGHVSRRGRRGAGHRGTCPTACPPEPRIAAVFRLVGFLHRNGMLNLRYARLLWRYLWRQLLTPAGWRWRTDGPVFFGKDLQLQIAKGAEIRFGR